MYSIYALVDPRDNSTFYIGQSTDVYRRFVQHINCVEENNFQKNRIIWALRSLNLMVKMEILEQVEDRDSALEREQHWINEYLSRGHPLTNLVIVNTSQVMYVEEILVESDLNEAVDLDHPVDTMTAVLSTQAFPNFSEEDERQILEIVRVQKATIGQVVRSKIPAAMNPPRNNKFYPVVKYICDREGM